MVKITKHGHTLKQMAYARRVWGAQGNDKTNIALDVGYSPYVARSASSKIENTRGFQNALLQLSKESNTVALTILLEFKRRGVKEFSNKDLVGALNAIGSAWSKFQPKDPTEHNRTEGNKLRSVIMQRIQNQTVIQAPQDTPPQKIYDMGESLDELRNADLGF